MSRRLRLCLLALAITSLVVAQPKSDFLPLNTGNAKILRTVEGLPALGVAVGGLDGKGVAIVACEDGTVKLYPSEVGKDLLADTTKAVTIKAGTGVVTAATAAGGTAAVAFSDGKVVLFSVPGEKATHTLATNTTPRGLALSADGKTLAVAGDDATVQLFDAVGGKPLRKLAGATDWLLCAAFSDDGKLVAAGGHEGKLFVWDAAGGAKKFDAVIQNGPPPKDAPPSKLVLGAVAFSPDGKTVAVGADDGRMYQHDAASGKFVRKQEGHTGAVTSIVYHPRGDVMASGSKDRTVRLWQSNGGSTKTLEGHGAWVQGVALADKGCTMLSTGADKVVKVWDLGAIRPKEMPKKK